MPRRLHVVADTGSATVWGLMLCVLLIAAGAVLVLIAQVAVARHRVAAAADLTALAAAARPVEPGGCSFAARVAVTSEARLRSCRISGDTAEVTLELPLRGWLAQLPPARARARAGPGDGPPPPVFSGRPALGR